MSNLAQQDTGAEGLMENRITRWVYDHSPAWAQHLYASAFGYWKIRQRYGKDYKRWSEFFENAATWSRSELEAYQQERLAATLQDAYEHVPFYRERFEARGLRPGDIKTVADLPKLPMLEKGELRQAGEQILSRRFSRKQIRSAVTSGSTGYPLTNYWSVEAEQRTYAFLWARCRRGVWRGVSYGSFTGLQIVRPEVVKPPFWRINFAAGQTCYSVFHMSPATLPLYLERLRRARHVYLEGYPSPIAMLGKYIVEQGIDWPCPPQAVYTTAEQLLPEYRQQIEEGFKTRVYDQYGQNEKVGTITEYECGHLHYDMDYGVIEFVPFGKADDGRTIYEMVCTGFENFAAPLIRYRVGDLALLVENPPACPVYAGPIVECVYGRTAQALVSRDGRRYTNISVIAKRCHHVDAMQCVQEQPGAVEIRVVRGAGFSDEDERNILQQFQAKMGQMEFAVRYVDAIERTASGKFLSIVSRVPPAAPGPPAAD